MISAAFSIRFDFLVEAASAKILLEADVQEHHSEIFYKVSNFRITGQGRSILPEINIRKEGSQWVHVDSGKATDLSIAVGQAIDARGQAESR